MHSERLSALQVADRSAPGLDQLVRFDAEYVIPCSRRSPHLVVLQQIGVNEHTKLSSVTKGGNAASGFVNRRA